MGFCGCGSEGRRTGRKPVMADVQPYLPGRSYEELILQRLRPGDIHTHVYAQQFHILNEKNEIQEFMLEARKEELF